MHKKLIQSSRLYSVNILGPPEKPKNAVFLAKSHNSITVGWEAGLNGGSEQKFKVLYRETGQENYQECMDSIDGLKTGQRINYTIDDLHPRKEYDIKIIAINNFMGGSTSQPAVLTVITEG